MLEAPGNAAARGRRPVLFMAGYAETGPAKPGTEQIGKLFPLDVLAMLETARAGQG